MPADNPTNVITVALEKADNTEFVRASSEPRGQPTPWTTVGFCYFNVETLLGDGCWVEMDFTRASVSFGRGRVWFKYAFSEFYSIWNLGSVNLEEVSRMILELSIRIF